MCKISLQSYRMKQKWNFVFSLLNKSLGFQALGTSDVFTGSF
jgi:hypothetical protein